MIRIIITLIIALSFLFLFDFYAFQAVEVATSQWDPSFRQFAFIAFWSFTLLTIVLLSSSNFNKFWKQHVRGYQLLRSIVIIAFISKFFMIAVMLLGDLHLILLDLIYPGPEHQRSLLVGQVALALGLLPLVMLTYGMLRNQHRYKLFKEQVKIANLPDKLKGLKIVQISDIHSGSFSSKEPILRGIELINAQKPDLVFFTGDLVNSVSMEMEPFMDVFNKIEARYGVHSILGNHDYGDYVRWPSLEEKKKNLEQLYDIHEKLGWNLLLNENELIEIEGVNVAVIGVENYSVKPHFQTYGNLLQAYAGTENAGLKLLLSHDPTHWRHEVLKQFEDIAITFSGHTHGMQFGLEIPGWFKWSPVKYVYKEWAGLYQEENQYLYVNRGFGYLGYPGRVGILPEITLIELIPA